MIHGTFSSHAQLSQIEQICGGSPILCPSSSLSSSSIADYSFSLSKTLNIPVYNFFDGSPSFYIHQQYKEIEQQKQVLEIQQLGDQKESFKSLDNFETIVLVMGHASQVIKETEMKAIEIKTLQVYSPFPTSHFLHSLPSSVKIICVVERVEEREERKSGAGDPFLDPLYLKVVEAISGSEIDLSNIKIISFTYQGEFTTTTATFLEQNLNSDSPPIYYHYNHPHLSSSPSSLPLLPLSPFISFLHSNFSNMRVWEVGSHTNTSLSSSSSFQLLSSPTLEVGFGLFVAYSHDKQTLLNSISTLLQEAKNYNITLSGMLERLLDKDNKEEAFLDQLKKELEQYAQLNPSTKSIITKLEKVDINLKPSLWLVCESNNTNPTSVLPILESGEDINVLFINSPQTNPTISQELKGIQMHKLK